VISITWFRSPAYLEATAKNPRLNRKLGAKQWLKPFKYHGDPVG